MSMKRNWIFAICLVLLGSAALAQDLNLDDPAPPLTGDTLDGVKVALPGPAGGKITFLAVAFSKGAGGRARPWTDLVFRDYGSDPKVTWYSVAMFERMRAFVRNVTVSSMRRTTPPQLQSHHLIISSGNRWRQSLGADDDGIAYVLLLDTNGKVAWMARGKPTPANYEALKAKIREIEVTQTTGGS